MQTQVLVQPPPLLALPRQAPPASFPRALRHHDLLTDLSHLLHPILDQVAQPPAAQSGPSYSPTLHVLLDDVPRSGPCDHTSLTSPQQYSISVSNSSQLAPHFPASHSRTLSPSDSSPRPSTETKPSARFSPSPSPPQIRPTTFPSPHSAPHHPNQFPSSANSFTPNMDRYSIANLADRYLQGSDKYSHNQHPLLDQRRMSEPAMRGSAASGYPTSTADLSNARYHQFQHQYSYVPPRSYGAPSSPLHRSSDARPIGSSSWKEDHQLPLHPYELEEPLSPLNPTFSGGESSPPMGMSTAMFESLHEDYGPSPPGTGTSTSSNAPATQQRAPTAGGPSSPSNSRQYSFVSLPGNAVKKRPRRRYDEIERLYQCSWPDCTKAYGTLNHLNAHITMQKHGSKRSPNEFKELRKQWRKTKREEAEAKALDAVRHGSHQHQHPSHHHTSRHSMSDAEYQTHNSRRPFDYTHHSGRSVQPTAPLDDFHDSLTHQQDVYPRRSQRYSPFVSPHLQHNGIQYPHPHSHGTSTSNIAVDRLPANSTLLTPLPGYEPSSMGGAPGFNAYDSYDLYRNDTHPRTGHGNTGSHGDRGRSRSGHVNLGPSHDHNCP